MRNLKKLLAVIVTIAMLATFAIPAFAAENEISADAEACADLGILLGDTGNGVTADYLAKETTRMQAAILTLRLFNLEDEAKAETSTENFADADEMVWEEGKAILAYLKANPELGWRGGDGGNFNPFDTISAQELYKVLLEALGYEQDVDFAWAEVFSFAEEKGLSKIADVENLTNDDLAVALMEVLALPLADGSMNLAAKLVAAGTIDKDAAVALGLVGDAAVTDVAAISAKAIKVTFAAPVVDTEKVAFSVKRGATAANVTVTWNEAKTEATLTQAANFAEATYTVTVSYDEKEVATKDITFTQQKVAKIEFTSPSVAVTVGSTPVYGYVTYKVYDQYGNDITTTSMANSLSPQVGSGTAEIRNGLMTITEATGGPALITLQNLSVILYDTASGVTATKSLPVSTVVGTLSEFELGSLDNVKLTEGDTTSVYYIPYTAKDMAGNETKNYELVRGGLIDSITGGDVDLVVSLQNNVSAKVVRDPANSKNAAIEVRYIGGPTYTMDMPVTITAMTYTGKTSTAQTTLVRSTDLDRITLYAPAQTVAANDVDVEIPYEAYDTAGNLTNKYKDLKNLTGYNVSLLRVVEKADGTAKILFNAPSTNGPVTLSATTPTSKISNILQINVQKDAYPATVTLDTSVLVTAMEQGATQTIKINDKAAAKNAIRVYDQYDRLLDNKALDAELHATTGEYKIEIAVTGDISVDQSTLTGSSVNPTLTADNVPGGTGTITVKLIKKAGTVEMDSASASISVVKTGDIKGYTMEGAKDALYTVTADDTITKQEEEYAYNAKVYGTTAAGTKVLLAGTPIAGTSVGPDFVVTSTSPSALAFDGVKVVAKKLADTKDTATSTLVVTVVHNNTVKALSTTVTSSKAAPKAEEVVLKGANSDGIANAKATNGSTYLVQKFAANGAETTSPFHFAIKDSYGTEGMRFASFHIAKVTNAAGVAKSTYGSTIDKDGNLYVNDASGEFIYVTAVTNNGLSATMKIEIN
jgi:hypothetical protein